MMFNFSYTQEIYDEKNEHGRRYLEWTNEKKTWNYTNCTVDVIGHKDGAHIVLRRDRKGESSFKNSKFVLKLMMGFTITDVQKNQSDFVSKLIFTIQQSSDKNHRDLENVKIESDDKDAIDTLYDIIQEKMKQQDSRNIIAFNYLPKNSKIIPIIYQPRVDAWKNFLREINVHKDGDTLKITLAFQGEVLRKFFLIDPFYKLFRLLRYKRTVDIETFEIRENQFYFENIYSNNDVLFDDSTHNKKEISIKYYFSDKNHPVIFINTSNHAMAPHDNNHDFWKWEYVPWSNDTPLECGTKTRDETEKYYRRF